MDQVNYGSLPGLMLEKHTKSLKGVAIAFTIIGLWSVNLVIGLSLDLTKTPYFYIGIILFLQAFLYTGLFITAHDAMHRSLIVQNPRLNDQIGSLTVFLYLFFSYKKLLKNHWLHHRHPATTADPDFHDGKHPHPILWYFNFMKRYFGWRQVVGITIAYYGAQYIFQVSESNLTLFWILPSILSSLQLFYFGTFLPHRELPEGYGSLHRARSNNLPSVLSFLSCYHFGYHEEHHEYPSAPWWQLPMVRRMRLETLGAGAIESQSR
ncbi:MAG: fatty acid desaturase [Leptolyngbyaceae cyanobacterium bins.349]|nr:fatty acid desaturase [Leptolyngbyaceae cyanobacterium bins.349]